MTVKDKILIVISAIGAFCSAVFYVLFRQAKDEKKSLDKELTEEKEKSEKIQSVAEIKGSGRENVEKADSRINDVVNGFDTVSNIMSELKTNSDTRNR